MLDPKKDLLTFMCELNNVYITLWWLLSWWSIVIPDRKTRPWFTPAQTQPDVTRNWPRPGDWPCSSHRLSDHQSLTIVTWHTRNGTFVVADCCLHFISLRPELCCHRQRVSGSHHQRLYRKKVVYKLFAMEIGKRKNIKNGNSQEYLLSNKMLHD